MVIHVLIDLLGVNIILLLFVKSTMKCLHLIKQTVSLQISCLGNLKFHLTLKYSKNMVLLG